MKNKNNSISRFFWIYFSSVFILIVSSGIFYFFEQKSALEKEEYSSILLYAKMQQYTGNTFYDKLFSFELKSKYKPWYEKNVMHKDGQFFVYEAPTQDPTQFLIIKKTTNVFEKNRITLMINIFIVVISLLVVFMFISLFLARESIRPLNDMIQNLDDFIKNLVHDLNTPATSILLNAQLLQTKKGKNDDKRIARIESSTKEILSLYKNLSVLLNEHKFELIQQDISPIIKNIIESFKDQHTNIEFKFISEDECFLKIDKQALEQILNNLISNACKYKAKENSFVHVHLENRQLIIKDNGLGMQYPEKVFERLYSEHTKGHGIGMYIVQKLTEAMNIRIQFNSKKDVGTEVILILEV